MKNFRSALPFLLVLIGFAAYLGWMIPAVTSSTGDSVTARGQLGDSFGVLNSLFSGLGFAAIVVTLWIQQKQIEIQQEQIKSQEQERVEEVSERRSLFNMESSIKAMGRAHELLLNENNDRGTWIEAARLLGHAKVLGEGVTIDCHKRVLEASRLQYRTFFSDLLVNKSAAFFYGVDRTLLVSEAAQASTAPRIIIGGAQVSDIRQLDEASIYRVWEAAQWPADFEDPVGPTFSGAERERLIFNARGLREYLNFKDEYTSVGGQLRPRRRPGSEAES